MDFSATLRGLGEDRRIVEALELHSSDLKAINTQHQPDNVAPRRNDEVVLEADTLTATLRPYSWNVIVTETVAT